MCLNTLSQAPQSNIVKNINFIFVYSLVLFIILCFICKIFWFLYKSQYAHWQRFSLHPCLLYPFHLPHLPPFPLVTITLFSVSVLFWFVYLFFFFLVEVTFTQHKINLLWGGHTHGMREFPGPGTELSYCSVNAESLTAKPPGKSWPFQRTQFKRI